MVFRPREILDDVAAVANGAAAAAAGVRSEAGSVVRRKLQEAAEQMDLAQRDDIEALQQTVAALEARVAALEAQAPKSRTKKT